MGFDVATAYGATRRVACAAVLPLALAGCAESASGDTSTIDGRPAESGVERQRGVAWTAGPDSIDATDMDVLADLGVNWITQTPFGWQSEVDGPELRMNRGRRVWWGERDNGIRVTTLTARNSGIATLLKPHLWLSSRDRDVWRGQIAMKTEADWKTWFEDYTEFIVHYAVLAEELGIEALCVGTELHGTVHREAEWRAVVDQVRQVYSGKLTYAANWYQEYQEVPFWDALDWIGVQAYFPLTDSEYPSADELDRGWDGWVDEISELQARVKRPVLFTEVGYRSVPFVGKDPWTWPNRGEDSQDPRAFQAQAEAYDALFRAVWDQPWFEGIYLWKWYPSTGRQRNRSADFTPQGKPAERVMARWFTDSVAVN